MPLVCKLFIKWIKERPTAEHMGKHSLKGKIGATTILQQKQQPCKVPPDWGGLCWMEQALCPCSAAVCLVPPAKAAQAENTSSTPCTKCRIPTLHPWKVSSFIRSCSAPTNSKNCSHSKCGFSQLPQNPLFLFRISQHYLLLLSKVQLEFGSFCINP